MLKHSLIVILAVIASNAAFAADKCNAGPKDQWQSMVMLEKKLSAEGWKIKTTKIDKGCYEVYGVDTKGHRAETYFHPKTLNAVKDSS
jgi:hypothetical protein